MTTAEVATQFSSLCRKGQFVEAIETLYADDMVSVEAADYQGTGRELRGKDAVKRKNIAWFEDNDVHSVSVTGPFASPERFAVLFSFDWTQKASGNRVQLHEVAVYTVDGGKIVREEFLYGAGE